MPFSIKEAIIQTFACSFSICHWNIFQSWMLLELFKVKIMTTVKIVVKIRNLEFLILKSQVDKLTWFPTQGQESDFLFLTCIILLSFNEALLPVLLCQCNILVFFSTLSPQILQTSDHKFLASLKIFPLPFWNFLLQ